MYVLVYVCTYIYMYVSMSIHIDVYLYMYACLFVGRSIFMPVPPPPSSPLAFFFSRYIYMYLFHWPQEGELEGPNRKARRVRTGARIQQIYFVGHGARLGLGNGSIYWSRW